MTLPVDSRIAAEPGPDERKTVDITVPVVQKAMTELLARSYDDGITGHSDMSDETRAAMYAVLDIIEAMRMGLEHQQRSLTASEQRVKELEGFKSLYAATAKLAADQHEKLSEWMRPGPNGALVLTPLGVEMLDSYDKMSQQHGRYKAALTDIANADYRGNRSAESTMAFRALQEPA